jgi:hypothetical protein
VLQQTPPVASPVNTLEGVIRGEEMLRYVDDEPPVRSVYLPVLRGHVPHPLEVFDFAEPAFVTGDREETNVASQALFLMNDPEVQRYAASLADRVLARPGSDDGRISYAFELAVGRKPTATEVSAVRGFFETFKNAAPKKQPDAPRRPDPRAGGRRGRRPAPPAAAKEPSPADVKRAAWSAFCQSLFMSAEFRYVD